MTETSDKDDIELTEDGKIIVEDDESPEFNEDLTF